MKRSLPTGQYSLGTQCAWCLKKKNLPMGNGSHGICVPCKEDMLREHQQLRASRQEQDTLAHVEDELRQPEPRKRGRA